MSTKINFSIPLEGKPEQPIQLAAFFFDRGGKLIQSSMLDNGNFVLETPDEATLQEGKVFIAPLDLKEQRELNLDDILKRNPFQIPIPTKLSDIIKLPAFIDGWWKKWLFCNCTITGKVLNGNCGGQQGIEGARVNIYEIDAFPIIIHRIPDFDIIKLRDRIWQEIQIPRPFPEPDPLPFKKLSLDKATDFSFNLNDTAKRTGLQNIEMLKNTNFDSSSFTNLKDFIPKENLSNFFSQSPLLVKEYLSKNFRFFVPLICKWWYRYINKYSLGSVITNADGSFSLDISYFCFGDIPDLYFEVEYLIDGVWTKVYHPHIACNTYWDYKCGTEINIYVHDDRIKCKPGDNGYQEKEIVFRSIGNSCIVTNVQQSGASIGLPFDLSNATFDNNPFGGSLVPLIDFGAKLCDAIDGGQNYWYKWSYRKQGELNFRPVDAPMSVQYEIKRFDIGGNLIGIDYPYYQYGPDARGLYKILRRHIPASEGGYEIVGGYGASFKTTANFDTTALASRNAAGQVTDWKDGVYELMFELFDNAGNKVDNWEAQSVQFFVIKRKNPATPGAVETTEDNVAIINQYKIFNGVNTQGFNMNLFIDNNPAEATVSEAWVDVPANSGGECGFIYYNTPGMAVDKNKEVHLQFHAWQKNKFANFGFSVIKGNGTITFGTGGKVDIPSCNLNRHTPAPPVELWEDVSVFNNDGVGNFTGTGLTVDELTGVCDSAAFSQSAGASATAHNGTEWLPNYVSQTKAFALDTQ